VFERGRGGVEGSDCAGLDGDGVGFFELGFISIQFERRRLTGKGTLRKTANGTMGTLMRLRILGKGGVINVWVWAMIE
jgi:hypothetical protein